MKLIADFITTEEQAGLVIYKLTRKAQVAQGPFVFEYEELDATLHKKHRVLAEFPHIRTISGHPWLSDLRGHRLDNDKLVHLKVYKDTDAN